MSRPLNHTLALSQSGGHGPALRAAGARCAESAEAQSATGRSRPELPKSLNLNR
jgi:hypothetical protein